ncbi:hypothetical protein ACQFME_004271 [Escherichia coli]|uniref:Uncharacterized protein n=1 Tax=Escherichia coli TaxID=562 RepID=A0A771LXV7_ECOLX|nr:hypothetical protein [Escherichia coli]EFA4243674.1 hypothetical protein [Escherichia coli O36:H5]EFA4286402.1 hypothetical protein [Escherichia coli O36]ALL93930.1 hypothetical protein AKK22_14655 [Escherichia coli]EEW0696495.1 hypothetical protein [Escherichia coli]EEW3200565.1 hypothetical protein [Escherichia coli]
MIRRIVNSLYHRYNRCPRVGQWFATSNGHVLRVCLVSTESQKVVCQVQGRTHTLSYPLVAFQSGKMFKRLGGGYASV